MTTSMPHEQPSESLSRDELSKLLTRYSWLTRTRPGVLGGGLIKLLTPENRRRIILSEPGVRVLADPFSHLGNELLLTGTYEPETVKIFRDEIKPGAKVLDIGANEGFFSAWAGLLVGDDGYIVAVEPQVRLRDLIEINLRINSVSNFTIFSNAIGGQDGELGWINLFPAWNSGASGLINRYRFSWSTQATPFISVSRIFRESGLESFDFVKVDVEGFESRVVPALIPSVKAGKIRTLLLDYHYRILKENHINPADIHNMLISSGMSPRDGEPERHESYILYDFRGP
jgi:FkbM family methyltransferase